jgi:hypothetical protein
MTSDDSHGSGQPGGDRPGHRDQRASADATGATRPLVLELTLADGEPLSGTVGLPGCQPPLAFHGWIDLMTAIHMLRADRVRDPPVSH